VGRSRKHSEEPRFVRDSALTAAPSGFLEGPYQETSENEVRASIWKYLERKVPPEKEGQLFQPKQYLFSNVLESLKALCLLKDGIELPAWLENAPSFAPTVPIGEVLSVKNGILHLPTRTLYPHSVALFCSVVSSATFDPCASMPHRWFRFLDELFGTDVDAKECLQEWIGYNLLPDTAQQKLFLIVGPKRSGKGTIARVMAALAGEGGIGSMTLAALSERFGLQQLVKSSAVLSRTLGSAIGQT
jgi:putative DNA primase/helicase